MNNQLSIASHSFCSNALAECPHCPKLTSMEKISFTFDVAKSTQKKKSFSWRTAMNARASEKALDFVYVGDIGDDVCISHPAPRRELSICINLYLQLINIKRFIMSYTRSARQMESIQQKKGRINASTAFSFRMLFRFSDANITPFPFRILFGISHLNFRMRSKDWSTLASF